MDEVDVFPSWWGQLPLPPVRPRYVIVAVTGYPMGRAEAERSGARKARTVWVVLDRLFQSLPVGPEHFKKENAEAEREAFEGHWEQYLTTGEYTAPPFDSGKGERPQRGFRPTCPRCQIRATKLHQTVCEHCGASLYR